MLETRTIYYASRIKRKVSIAGDVTGVLTGGGDTYSILHQRALGGRLVISLLPDNPKPVFTDVFNIGIQHKHST